MCLALVEDPHFGEGDIHGCDGGANQVNGFEDALWAIVEVLAEDCQGPVPLVGVVGEIGVVWGRE